MNRNDARPKKVTISLRVDDGVKTAAKYYARQRQVPLAEVVRDLLAGYVEACALENERASPDLLGAKPRQFAGVPYPRASASLSAAPAVRRMPR